jgi:hypothetical protein
LALTMKLYGNALMQMAAGSVSWPTDTIKVMLLKPSYTPDQDGHIYKDPGLGTGGTANEFPVAGDYLAGGSALQNKTKTYTGATNETKLDADDVAWTNLSGTVRYVAIVKSRGGAATADELIGWGDFGADQILSGVGLSIAWNAGGIFAGTVA